MDIHSGVARRLEVVQTGRRRRWTAQEKCRILEESFSGEASVSEVARRHGIAPSHLFAWRRAVRVEAPNEAGPFVPAMILDRNDGTEAPTVTAAAAPVIVLELAGGGKVSIGAEASPALVQAVLRALGR